MKIKVGAHDIEITHKKDTKNDGYFISTTNTINIASNATQTRKGASLIHEINHAICITFDEEKNGHQLLTTMSEMMFQVLHDNGLLSKKFYKLLDK